MNIRRQEDTLFEQWKTKYPSTTFTLDGCPCPEDYLREDVKVIFVLKDSNLGESYSKPSYDQRFELANSPDEWWRTIGSWCVSIRNPTWSWDKIRQSVVSIDDIRAQLSKHCFIQLKKEAGVGSVSNKKIEAFVSQDKEEIKKQISIYNPDVIVACGNAAQLIKVFNLSETDRKETTHGVGFWFFVRDRKDCVIIDYCHPSVRAGRKIKGLIAKGLCIAVSEVGEA